MTAEQGVTHHGGCHCGRIRFEVNAPKSIEVVDCNCSICSMTGYVHLIVEKSAFRLIQGEESITTYRFGSGEAQHFFCSHCGIKSFYLPRSHPNGVSVNANCLDPGTVESIEITPFDGRNWEKNISKLSRISD